MITTLLAPYERTEQDVTFVSMGTMNFLHVRRSIMERRLFVFDMDGTLIRNTTGLLELAKVLGTENKLIEMENRFSKKELSTYDFTQEISQL